MLRTQFSSLSFLSNWRTILVYFFIAPIIDMALLVLIDAQYTGQFNWYVVLASIAIDAAKLSLSTISQSLIYDAYLGIDYEIIAKRPFSPRYWLSKALTALTAGLALAATNLLLAVLFGAPLILIERVILTLPLLCLFGLVLGFSSWAISWQMNDPYFLANFVEAIMSLAAGVLVVISAYPTWLTRIAQLFPFSEPINLIKFGHAHLANSFWVTAIWLLVGLIAYVLQIKRVLQTRQHKYN